MFGTNRESYSYFDVYLRESQRTFDLEVDYTTYDSKRSALFRWRAIKIPFDKIIDWLVTLNLNIATDVWDSWCWWQALMFVANFQHYDQAPVWIIQYHHTVWDILYETYCMMLATSLKGASKRWSFLNKTYKLYYISFDVLWITDYAFSLISQIIIRLSFETIILNIGKIPRR